MARLRRLFASLVVTAVVWAVAAPGAAASPPEWNLTKIGAPRSAAGIVIAVVDTGVDPKHSVFDGRLLPAINLVDDGKSGDPEGHGTHVAGTAAGADRGCGNIGVAPDAKILPVRVLDAEGSGNSSTVAEGIRRAADAGAAVINLSLGADVVIRNVVGSGMESAIEYAWSKGSIAVLAAGNDGMFGTLGSGYGDLPAVVVTATDAFDASPSYATDVGTAKWGIAAPGGDGTGERGRDILASYPGGQCALLAGTSMAAPHVSGALAVLRAQGYNPQQAVDRILATAKDLGNERRFGSGLLDLTAAAASGPPTTSPPTTTPRTTTPPQTAPPTTQPATTQPPSATPTTAGTASAPPTTTDESPTPGAAEPGTAPAGDPDPSVLSGSADGTPPDTAAGGGNEVAGGLIVNDEPDENSVPVGLVAVGVLGILGAGAGTVVVRGRLTP